MAFRVHPDGSITVDTLEEALQVQAALDGQRPTRMQLIASAHQEAVNQMTAVREARIRQAEEARASGGDSSSKDPWMGFLTALAEYQGEELDTEALAPLLGVEPMGVGPRLGKVRRELARRNINLDRHLYRKSKDGKSVWMVSYEFPHVAQK